MHWGSKHFYESVRQQVESDEEQKYKTSWQATVSIYSARNYKLSKKNITLFSLDYA